MAVAISITTGNACWYDLKMLKGRFFRRLFLVSVALLVAGCVESEPIAAQRYVESDQMMRQMEDNLAASTALSKVVDIDHSRLAQKAVSPMAPAKVLIFCDALL